MTASETEQHLSICEVADILTRLNPNKQSRNAGTALGNRLKQQIANLINQGETPNALLDGLFGQIISRHMPYRTQSLESLIKARKSKASNWLTFSLLSDNMRDPSIRIMFDQAERIMELRQDRAGIYADMQLCQADATLHLMPFRKVTEYLLKESAHPPLEPNGLAFLIDRMRMDVQQMQCWLQHQTQQLLEVSPKAPEWAQFRVAAMTTGVRLAHQLHSRLELLWTCRTLFEGANQQLRLGLLEFDGNRLIIDQLADSLNQIQTELNRDLYSHMQVLEGQFKCIASNKDIIHWRIIGDDGPMYRLSLDRRVEPLEHRRLMSALTAPYIAVSNLIADTVATCHMMNEKVAQIVASPAYTQQIEQHMREAAPDIGTPMPGDISDTL